MKTIIHFHLLVIGSVLLSVDSCRNKKTTTTATASTTQQTATTTATQTAPEPIKSIVPPKEEATIRFIASFYSIGQGIDGKTHDDFVKFLESYPKKIAYDPKHRGREGEIDYCLALKEMSETEQDEFVRKAKKILSTNVNVNENAVCQNKKSGAPSEEKYRIVISFFSIGEGINLNVHEKFEKFLSEYKPKITYEPAKWGREGEVDYCLTLTELSASQQEEFVMKTKEIVTKKVHITENGICMH